ncbi:MAG: RNA polymerase sigma factor [Blastocatellia bacterium]|nr:RNA polymerase sigma factor [Blastocatellia bacterium]
MPNDMDQELLTRAQAGDRAAFGALYERHHAVVWRFTLHRVHQVPVTEDIVHDTFLEVLKHEERFEPDRGVEFVTYLCSIADHLIRKHYRKEARTAAVLDWLLPGRDFEGAGASERKFNRLLDLERALDRLPERQREAYRLSEAQDATMDQISEELGVSLPATKSLLFRARTGVRKFLGLAPEPES